MSCSGLQEEEGLLEGISEGALRRGSKKEFLEGMSQDIKIRPLWAFQRVRPLSSVT